MVSHNALTASGKIRAVMSHTSRVRTIPPITPTDPVVQIQIGSWLLGVDADTGALVATDGEVTRVLAEPAPLPPPVETDPPEGEDV